MEKQNPDDLNNPSFYEYALVIHPALAVQEKIMAEQQFFATGFEEYAPAETKPHVTLARFLAREAMEDTMIRWMNNIFSHQTGFNVTLNNYGGTPPHTIYLRIQNMGPFEEMARGLKVVDTYVSSCSCPPMTLVSKPFLEIASGLPETIFFKALTLYAHKSFHETFMVNELLLLRRKHPGDTTRVHYVFGLRPQETGIPVTI